MARSGSSAASTLAANAGVLFFPADLALELGTEGYSPRVLRKVEYAGGNAPSFRQASEVLLRLADLKVDPKHVQRVTLRLGRERQEHSEEAVRQHKAGRLAPKHKEPPAVAVVFVDAGKVQMRSDSKGPGVRDPHWRDTKVASLASFPAVEHFDDPQPEPPPAFLDPPRVVRLCAGLSRVRDREPAESSPQADAPKEAAESERTSPRPLVRTTVATLGDSESFGWRVSAEAHKRGFYGACKAAVVGDGGNWIVPLADLHFPGWVQILDFLHLLAHLFAAAQAAWPDAGRRRWLLYTKLIRAAWRGNVPEIQRLLDHLQERLGLPPDDARDDDPRARLQRVRNYVETNRKRMDYPTYRRNGLPVTSALVESLIKQFNQRVKGTEKFWREAGIQAVLEVRAAYLSEDNRAEDHYARRPIPRASRRGPLPNVA